MTKTNRIEYKQELTDRLEKEVIAFLNYHEGGIITGLVDRLVEGLADSQKKDNYLKLCINSPKHN